MKPCPNPGEGVHQWAFYAYNTMRARGATHNEAESYCHQYASRPLKPGDIPTSATKSYGDYHRSPRPQFDQKAVERLAAQLPRFALASLKSRSPLDPDAQTASTFLHNLYQPGEKVFLTTKFTSRNGTLWERQADDSCLDKSSLEADFSKPAQGEGAWFLANPINGEWINLPRLVSERNPEGRTRRSEENVTDFRFLVLESDVTAPELWIPTLAQLPLRIASVATSGGKSIHALVHTGAKNAAEWRRFRDHVQPALCKLGADPAAMTPVRLTRLPFCFREDKGKWQELLFLNPAPDGRPICELKIMREEGGAV